MPNYTPNLNLTKQLENENYDINIHNSNYDIIDNAMQETNEKIDNINLTATNVSIADTGNKFTATNVEGALNELFQYADSGKTTIATTIGSPLASTDSFSTMGIKIGEQITRGINIANTMLNGL